MSARTSVAAVDLGAESGRVVAVSFDGRRFSTEVAARFPTTSRAVGGVLRWDVEALWREVVAGLGALAQLPGPAGRAGVRSVGVDTWGVDHGILDAAGTLTADPSCYRDPRQAAAMEELLRTVDAADLFAATGTSVMAINSVFALLADGAAGRPAAGHRLLMLPDLFHDRLSGVAATERTAASTTGLFDTRTRAWADALVARLGLPRGLFGDLVDAGTDLGPVTGDVAAVLPGVRVVAPAGHDTASAVLATPFDDPDGLFLSSGTWSLLGVERAAPLVTPAAFTAGLTNETGFGATTQLLRTGDGLWILQECRRQWAREGLDLGYGDLAALAAAEPPLRSVVDTGEEEFRAPGDMPRRLREHCARHGEPVPETVGALARCVVDSLALGYRRTVEDLAAVTGRAAPSITVTGGGAQHAVLAQATADATGLPVRCGPVEATALGNAGAQLVALGELAGADDVRRAVAATAAVRTLEPRPSPAWDDAADRLSRRRSASGPRTTPTHDGVTT
ncbi:rhamnulokinase [Kineococcus rubinsiae]|uniref:rhamnulokinase n=1 Tax=Kineococcus rubinsiae TaxID=2609562 RepID=UPI0014315FBA|nr:rhamnulokinase family protein [Kineococcus rubinsiae]